MDAPLRFHAKPGPLVFFIKQWMFKRFTDVQRQKEQESKVVDALPYPNKLGRIFMS